MPQSDSIDVMSKASPDLFPRRSGEDDLRWASDGIDYLFEVDAKTPAARSQLEGLQRRVSERIRKPAAAMAPPIVDA